MDSLEGLKKTIFGLPVWVWLIILVIAVYAIYVHWDKIKALWDPAKDAAGKAADAAKDAAGKAADAAKGAAGKVKTASSMRAHCGTCTEEKPSGIRAAFAAASRQDGLTGGDARRIAMMNGDDVFKAGMDSLNESRMLAAEDGNPTFGADHTADMISGAEHSAGMSGSDYASHMQGSLPRDTADSHKKWTSSLIAHAKGDDSGDGVDDSRYLSKLSSAYGAEFEESPLVGVHSTWQIMNARARDAETLSKHGFNTGQVEGGGREVGQRALGASRIANLQCEDGCSV